MMDITTRGNSKFINEEKHGKKIQYAFDRYNCTQYLAQYNYGTISIYFMQMDCAEYNSLKGINATRVVALFRVIKYEGIYIANY